MRHLYASALYKISSQDPHMRHLYTRPPEIPGLPRSLNKSFLQDLFTRPLWEISIQELSTRSLQKTSVRDLYTRALCKISSQDPHMKHLYARSPDIPGPLRSLHRSSLQDLSTRPLWEISIQELSTRSLHKSPLQDLFTGPYMRHLYAISLDILGPPRSPHRNSLQDLFTRPPWQISIQDSLRSPDIPGPPRSPHRSSLQDLFTRPLRSPGIPGPPRSLHRSSLQDLFTSPIWDKSSLRSPHIPGPPRSLNRSSLQDLFTRPLWEISIQEFSTRSLDKTSMRDLYTRSPDIPGPLRPTRSLHKTSIRIQHAESTERVARTQSKSAPRYSESDPTRPNSAEGCASRNKKCARLSASDVPSAKWARRYSQSDPTRAKSREGCVCKHKIGTAPQRDSKNHSSDGTLTSELQYEMRFFDVLWRKYCACHEKMSPRHTKSCNCHAKWCQHSRSKFDDSFTKRAFRALQDRFQEREILRLPRKMTIFHHLQFRATPTTILHTSQNPYVLHISGFPKIDTARRRERTSEMDLVGAPFRAGEMQIFDLEGNFSPRGLSDFPPAPTHTTDLHQMLFYYRKNPIVWPHCLGNFISFHTELGTEQTCVMLAGSPVGPASDLLKTMHPTDPGIIQIYDIWLQF